SFPNSPPLLFSFTLRPPPSPSSPPPPPPSPSTLNFPHNSSSLSLSLPLVSSIYVLLSGKAGNQSGICFPLASTTAKPGPDSSDRLIALGMGFAKGISSTVFTNRFTSFSTPDFNRQPSWWIAAAPLNPCAELRSCIALATSNTFDSVRLQLLVYAAAVVARVCRYSEANRVRVLRAGASADLYPTDWHICAIAILAISAAKVDGSVSGSSAGVAAAAAGVFRRRRADLVFMVVEGSSFEEGDGVEKRMNGCC
ncbi:hypothetical protein LINPERHAP1_LOCUS38118, partial [Linum perenne]